MHGIRKEVRQSGAAYWDALRLVPARLYVFKDGREVARTTPARSSVTRLGEVEGWEVTYRPLQG